MKGITMKFKPPPLQKEWEERNKLQAEGYKLWNEGNKLCIEGDKLWMKGFELCDEGHKLRVEGHKLCIEGDKLWDAAIRKHYGADATVKWRTWHKNNEHTCHIGGDVYV